MLDNVALALKGAGSSIDKLTQVRVYVTDIASWPAFNALYAKWAGNARPARCVVPVPQLHYGFKIEIEAVAVNRDRATCSAVMPGLGGRSRPMHGRKRGAGPPGMTERSPQLTGPASSSG